MVLTSGPCYDKMHGPHMQEEWIVSTRQQRGPEVSAITRTSHRSSLWKVQGWGTNLRGPEDIAGWSRPHKRFRAAPHDVWLMSQVSATTRTFHSEAR
jgi:hypothetical protein